MGKTSKENAVNFFKIYTKSPRCAGRTEGQRDEGLMVGAFRSSILWS